MKKKTKNSLFRIAILGLMVVTLGCVSESRQIELGREALAKRARAIPNPNALYMVPASGLFVENVLDISQDPPISIGPMYLPPGWTIGYDETLIQPKEDP